MQLSLSTTPFGRRPYTLAQTQAQIVANECDPDALVRKWLVFDDICAAMAAARPLGPVARRSEGAAVLLSPGYARRRQADHRLSVEQGAGAAGRRHGGEHPAPAPGDPRRPWDHYSPRQRQWEALRPERGGGRDHGGLRLRPHADRRPRRGIQPSRRRGGGRAASPAPAP